MSNQLFQVFSRAHFRFILKVSFMSTTKNDDITSRNSRYVKLREAFWEKENEWEQKVKVDVLNDSEKLIYELHRQACKAGRFTYRDPETGNQVFTRLKHFLRAKCCGSACRHCPYDHLNVPADRKKMKRFNSAFYVNGEPDIHRDALTHDNHRK